ncbi:MAG: trypsin-like peptidase domain-containing protein, partial [Candidatus Symbiothrix sp.]|nr:trypsin-like peptidase domain-containing protein [Candidatus Symbiothrix sp.]
MRRNGLFFLLLSLFSLSGAGVSAQISHGGKPFFLQNLPPSLLKGGVVGNAIEYSVAANPSFGGKFEMPAFDLDSVLQEDQLNERNMQRSYRFAHKFFTKIEKRKDAALTVLPDGTKIWQIHIRSKGAYSINVLLSDFELPQGGKLFVYNEDHSHVIGSFDYRNNSPEKILPIQPVAGESIIIEYSEPAGVSFEGNFMVSEVNHDYRDFLKREPGNDGGSIFSCMPDALCSEIDESLVRSTVLLIIDGSIACSGVLVNNTENDGTPYILTAVHCLNDSLEYGIYKNREHYTTISGTVITFFNYNRPVCGTRLKGTEELTMAEAYPRAIVEKRDVALLELREKPPVYYNAYYAGWNMEENGKTGMYTNLHHPSAAIKKYGKVNSNLSIVNYQSPNVFEYESHWKVPGWTIGSTYGGSSGSPLFDKNGLVIGTLSGGASYCNNSSPDGNPDYFTILYKSEETSDVDNQLKTYLDPNNKGLKQQTGMDPNIENPLFRLNNMDFPAGDVLEVKTLGSPDSGFAYGSNNLGTKEFAEEFTIENAVEVFGVYLFVPPLPSNGVTGVEISIYSGTTLPENLLQMQNFSPQYLDYSDTTGFNPKDKNMIN